MHKYKYIYIYNFTHICIFSNYFTHIYIFSYYYIHIYIQLLFQLMMQSTVFVFPLNLKLCVYDEIFWTPEFCALVSHSLYLDELNLFLAFSSFNLCFTRAWVIPENSLDIYLVFC